MTNEELTIMYKESKDDKYAEELLQQNEGLLWRCVRNEMRKGNLSVCCDCDDLLQEGKLALIHSAETYENGKGKKFSSYAYWLIMRSMDRFAEDNMTTVRIPIPVHKEILKIKEATENYERQEYGEHYLEYLEKSTRLSRKHITLDLETMHRFMVSRSLNAHASYNDESEELINSVPDERPTMHDLNIWLMSLRGELNELIKCLTEKEKEIILYRYGFITGQEETLESTGKKYNITKERVRQIEAKALRKLKRNVKENHENLYEYIEKPDSPVTGKTSTFYRVQA